MGTVVFPLREDVDESGQSLPLEGKVGKRSLLG